MKRSEALVLICNHLDFLDGKFCGYKKDYTTDSISKADIILTSLESMGMLPPIASKYENCHITINVNKDVEDYHYWDDEV